MKELNGLKGKIVKYDGDYSFIIDIDTSNFGDYISGGIVKEVHHEMDLKFVKKKRNGTYICIFSPTI